MTRARPVVLSALLSSACLWAPLASAAGGADIATPEAWPRIRKERIQKLLP